MEGEKSVAISETIAPMNLCLIAAEVHLLWLSFVGKFQYHLRKDKYQISLLQANHLHI